MTRLTDLTGKRIGKIKVIKQAKSISDSCGTTRAIWVCKCDCKRTVEISARYLRRAMKTQIENDYKCIFCRENKKKKRALKAKGLIQ